jgi:hypothetical protein
LRRRWSATSLGGSIPVRRAPARKEPAIANRGGRPHTFTKVANFGGGKIPNPALNEGLVTAPECPASVDIPPGGSTRISGLTVGNHRFQCCIHPWQRALVKVQARRSNDD